MSSTEAPTSTENTYVEVLEHPQSRGYRFWYQYDKEFFIKGVSSTDRKLTVPVIKICGYTGSSALVVVSCVTKSKPYRTHPCMIRGTTNCQKGVYLSEIECSSSETVVKLPKLCIQAHPQRLLSVEDALKERKKIRVDPFRCGFDHINYAKEFLDLGAVRLCFLVFIQGANEECSVAIPPVVSDIIYNSEMEDSKFSINIERYSETQCPADGGTKDIYVFCEEVVDRETQVYFFEVVANGQVMWQANPAVADVHKAAKTMWFKPPKFRSVSIREPVSVLIQLRGKNGSCSEATPFVYLPMDSSLNVLQAKFLNSAEPSTSNTNVLPSQCISS